MEAPPESAVLVVVPVAEGAGLEVASLPLG
jgi:hypothetical protein